jgi:uncharacterized protein with PQ loop repeat
MKQESKFKQFRKIQRRVRISFLMVVVGLLVLWYGIQLMESHTGADRPVMIVAVIWLVFWVVFMAMQIRLLTRERNRILLSEVRETENT